MSDRELMRVGSVAAIVGGLLAVVAAVTLWILVMGVLLGRKAAAV